MRNFIDLIKEQATLFAKEESLKLYDVTLRNESSGRVLRVTVDGDVTLDACAEISKKLSNWIDDYPANLIPYRSYSLEVSSLGIDRPLKSREDFEAHVGKICTIQTKEMDESGRKNYKGEILSTTDDIVKIYVEAESAEYEIDINNINKAKLDLNF